LFIVIFLNGLFNYSSFGPNHTYIHTYRHKPDEEDDVAHADAADAADDGDDGGRKQVAQQLSRFFFSFQTIRFNSVQLNCMFLASFGIHLIGFCGLYN